MPRMGMPRRLQPNVQSVKLVKPVNDADPFLAGFSNTFSSASSLAASAPTNSQTPLSMSFDSLSEPRTLVPARAHRVPCNVAQGAPVATTIHEVQRRVDEVRATVQRWDAMISEIGEATFTQVATTVVDVPFFKNVPKTLNDLRVRTGVVPAGTLVWLMFPQITTNELILMRMRTCDPDTGGCSVFYLPVGRMAMQDDELFGYLNINARMLPDQTHSQFVAGFHLPGTRNPCADRPNCILPRMGTASGPAAAGDDNDDY